MTRTSATTPSTVKYPCHLIDAFHSSLGALDIGAVVLDESGSVIFMNEAAQALLEAPDGALPLWTRRHVLSILCALDGRRTAIERWCRGNLLLRVQARPLGRLNCTVLEIDIARSPLKHSVARELSRSLRLRRSDAELLELLWRGMHDDEIAAALGLRAGRVQSKLDNLYRKLRVQLRTAAVLRAAQALAA